MSFEKIQWFKKFYHFNFVIFFCLHDISTCTIIQNISHSKKIDESCIIKQYLLFKFIFSFINSVKKCFHKIFVHDFKMSWIHFNSIFKQSDLINIMCDWMQFKNIKMRFLIFFIYWSIICKNSFEAINLINSLFYVFQDLLIMSNILSNKYKIHHCLCILQYWMIAE